MNGAPRLVVGLQKLADGAIRMVEAEEGQPNDHGYRTQQQQRVRLSKPKPWLGVHAEHALTLSKTHKHPS